MVEEAVDEQGKGAAPRRAEDDEAAFGFGQSRAGAEHGREAGERDPFAADGGDPGAADILDLDGAARHPDDLVDRRARDGVGLAAGADGQRRDDGQGERDFEGQGQPLPCPAGDVDQAADPLHIGSDHVHSDPAAADLADLAGGGEARREDQSVALRLIELGGALGRQCAVRHRLGGKRGAVDSAAVVADLDQDLVARLAGADPEPARGALAAPFAFGGRLDAMVDGVADDVGQRIADDLDHLAVQLDVATVYLERDLLAELTGKVADHARKTREEIVDPLHAGASDGVAHLGHARRDAFEGGFHFDSRRGAAEAPGEVVAREHEVGNAAHHPVEQVNRKADGAGGERRAGGGECRRGRGRLLVQCRDQGRVVVRRGFAAVDLQDELSDPVEDCQDCADEGGIGFSLAGADLG